MQNRMAPAAPAAITRRGLLAGAAGIAMPAAVGCRCGGASGGSGAGSPGGRGAGESGAALAVEPPWKELSFEASDVYTEPERALVRVPEGAAALPVVVALHGRGESGRGLDVGARGFRDYYGLDRIEGRLRAPPITREDLLGFTSDERLAQINGSLAKEAYRGVVLVTPFAPDLKDRSVAGAQRFGRFVTEVLLPRARSAAGVADASSAAGATSGPGGASSVAARTGIDGVSMGGRLALWVGLTFPSLFGAVGAMQPAVRPEEAEGVATLAKQARERNPALRIRLLSSEGDPFLEAVKAVSAAMKGAGVEHDLTIVPGPHNYEFNKGPGCAEMLLWQERALRGLGAP